MPFASRAQQRYLHAHPEKVGGEGKLKEWDAATDFSSLPEKRVGWMKDESEREKHSGTKGVFSAAAKRAGKSTSAYAETHKHDSGKTGNRARMALRYLAAKH